MVLILGLKGACQMKANNFLQQLKYPVQKRRAEFPRQMKLTVPGYQEKWKFKNSVCQRGQELRAETNYQVILVFIIYILEAFRGPDWTQKSPKASCICVWCPAEQNWAQNPGWYSSLCQGSRYRHRLMTSSNLKTLLWELQKLTLCNDFQTANGKYF